MITERLDNPEVLHTLERAVRTLAAAQNAKLTVTTDGHDIDVYVSLPDGFEYSHGHSGFGMSSKNDKMFITHFDVWHDVLAGISFPVWETGFGDDLDGVECSCVHN